MCTASACDNKIYNNKQVTIANYYRWCVARTIQRFISNAQSLHIHTRRKEEKQIRCPRSHQLFDNLFIIQTLAAATTDTKPFYPEIIVSPIEALERHRGRARERGNPFSDDESVTQCVLDETNILMRTKGKELIFTGINRVLQIIHLLFYLFTAIRSSFFFFRCFFISSVPFRPSILTNAKDTKKEKKSKTIDILLTSHFHREQLLIRRQ